jgi:hypothetical protein
MVRMTSLENGENAGGRRDGEFNEFAELGGRRCDALNQILQLKVN